MAILLRLEPYQIAKTWPLIEKMIEGACNRSGGRTGPGDLRGFAEKGDVQLWIAIDENGVCAVAGTNFVNYAKARAFRIQFGTGRNRQVWQHFMEDMCAWAKTQGATIAEGDFRKGWMRVLPGWKHTHNLLERTL